jgi:hypothetical protein
MSMNSLTVGVEPFYGKGPHSLLWAGLRTAIRKTVVSGMPKRLNYFVISITYKRYKHLLAGCGI